MNNPFEYVPDKECGAAFDHLLERIEVLKHSPRPEDKAFCRELEAGKMLGVLIATDRDGVRHTLYAFSGQLGGGFRREGFVEPVFDYLQPDGYFKTREADISRQNLQISTYEKGPLAEITEAYRGIKERLDARIADFKEKCRQSKARRAARRAAGNPDTAELAEMIRRSQFEKAELRRLKSLVKTELTPYSARLEEAQARLAALKEKRRADSEALQDWLFSNLILLNGLGESRSVKEIFAETAVRVAPSGAGECCAPKLLQAAYRRGWKPVSIAEYWYGNPKEGEIRIHGRYYPACRGKCLPLLSWMLRGLDVEPPLSAGRKESASCEPEILYENQWFCVVDKPAGMLSVPGKGTACSLQQWLEDRYGPEKDVKMAHRLDQDTSGLLIATFGQEALKEMQALFATRKVHKTYVAVLEGIPVSVPAQGRIELPLVPDWLDRPRQRVDFDRGKESLTDYRIVDTCDGRAQVEFHPLTGRTHQLRVHAASEYGLGMAIAGDRLYGSSKESDSHRLLLHAHKIEFTYPLDGHRYSFRSDVPFLKNGEKL